jgi:hypothetical protein
VPTTPRPKPSSSAPRLRSGKRSRPHSSHPIPKLGRDLLGLDPQAMTTPLCATIAGFSLHAARSVHAQDRDALERLCRYGLRAPFSQERLTLRDDGCVVYRLRRPWPNPAGANCLILQPTEFLRRLAALIPAPYTNLVRYHGVFAARSSAYARLPKPPSRVPRPGVLPSHDAQPPAVPMTSTALPPDSNPVAPPRNRHRKSTWAQLLRRVFFLDALSCPRCDTTMVVLALLSDPTVVRKILLHLELPANLPTPAPAVIARDDAFDLDACPHTTRPPP